MESPLGNAKWSSDRGVDRFRATSGSGFFFGNPVDVNKSIHYNDRLLFHPAKGHLLTVAQPRSGKGATLIINNLLCYRGSAVVTDPKGELAWITAPRRRQLGQQIRILDPWHDVNRRYGSQVGVKEQVSRFNPLSVLKVRTYTLPQRTGQRVRQPCAGWIYARACLPWTWPEGALLPRNPQRQDFRVPTPTAN